MDEVEALRAEVARLRDELERVRTRATQDHQRAQQLLDSVPTGLVEFADDSNCTWANRAFLDMVGLELADVLGEGWRRTVHPDDDAITRAMAVADVTARGEVRHVDVHGGIHVCDSSLVQLHRVDAEGRQRSRPLVHVHDLTASRTSTDRALQQEARFRRLFDCATVAMLVTDFEGLVLDVNPAWCDLMRLDPREVVGESCLAMLPVLVEEFPRESVDALAAGDDVSFGFEGWFPRLDGSRFWGRMAATFSTGPDGQPVIVSQYLDLDEVHASRQELSRRAAQDDLTGLANRTSLLAAVDAQLKGPPGPLAVLFCDLDRFKVVNDSLGHDAGDTVLRAVADRLRSACREDDLVARLGGDEFVVLLSGTTGPQDALATASRLHEAAQAAIDHLALPVSCGASMGVAVVDTRTENLDAATLLRDADTAMYQAKDRSKGSGSGAVQLFTPQMRASATERVQVETDLRAAIECDELRVHYQPVVRLADGVRVGFEALVRWEHPLRGLLGPADFLDVAEEAGLGPAVDTVVIEQAVSFLARHPDCTVAVNVSPRHIGGGFAAGLARVLARHGVPGERLVVELLETSLLDASPQTVADLEAVSALGVELLIDDFGTGYSALSYLRRLPVHGLKLDRSFVADLPDDAGADRIAAAVLGVADGLGLRHVAEGIETAEQAAHLRGQGWECAQGFFYGRPHAEEHWFPAHALVVA